MIETYYIMEDEYKPSNNEPSQEWWDEAKFINENYSEYLKVWNKKGYLFKPSWILQKIYDYMRSIQCLQDEETVLKWLLISAGGMCVATLILSLIIIL